MEKIYDRRKWKKKDNAIKKRLNQDKIFNYMKLKQTNIYTKIYNSSKINLRSHLQID